LAIIAFCAALRASGGIGGRRGTFSLGVNPDPAAFPTPPDASSASPDPAAARLVIAIARPLQQLTDTLPVRAALSRLHLGGIAQGTHLPGRYRLAAAAIAAALLLAGPALAQEMPPAPPSGIWSGTLGDQEIRLCLGVKTSVGNGAYYYLRHLQLISLQADRQQGGWYERGVNARLDPAPRWTLTETPKGGLTGTWSQGGKSLPVRLDRISPSRRDATDDPPCGLMTFLKPRLTSPKLVRTPASLDGALYTRLVWDLGALSASALEGFDLPGDTAALRRVKKLIPSAAPAAVIDEGQSEYVACSLSAAGEFGEEGQYRHTVTPALILPHWLVSAEASSFSCGGPGPDLETRYQVFDLTAGAKVDPWSWFDGPPRNPKSLDPFEARPQLKALVEAAWRRAIAQSRDCADADPDEWDIHPAHEGLAFSPQLAHAPAACAADAVIPYPSLAALLTPAGKTAIASITTDLSNPPAPAAATAKKK